MTPFPRPSTDPPAEDFIQIHFKRCLLACCSTAGISTLGFLAVVVAAPPLRLVSLPLLSRNAWCHWPACWVMYGRRRRGAYSVCTHRASPTLHGRKKFTATQWPDGVTAATVGSSHRVVFQERKKQRGEEGDTRTQPLREET